MEWGTALHILRFLSFCLLLPKRGYQGSYNALNIKTVLVTVPRTHKVMNSGRTNSRTADTGKCGFKMAPRDARRIQVLT